MKRDGPSPYRRRANESFLGDLEQVDPGCNPAEPANDGGNKAVADSHQAEGDDSNHDAVLDDDAACLAPFAKSGEKAVFQCCEHGENMKHDVSPVLGVTRFLRSPTGQTMRFGADTDIAKIDEPAGALNGD